MAGSGIFCFANGGAAFISVAFVIGLVFIIAGAFEIVVGTRDDIDVFGGGVSFTSDGVMMIVFGAVILSGQVADDITAGMLFALWLLIEGVLAFADNFSPSLDAEGKDNAEMVLGAAMFAVCLYMFFNTRLLNINTIILIGIGIMLLGLRRFKLSFDIVYNKPGFLTGNEEKLNEAMEDEKKALAKAKQGIKEQKAAQRRIEKIKEEMIQERNVLTETALRKQALDEEKNNNIEER